MEKNKKIAFVVMKFEAVSWQEKRYTIIKEVLKEAGFDVIRADEINNSGPVVDEVCDYLQNADLVVIDSSGDSHSVSYEIGYCHGIKRSYDTTILMRDQNSPQIPFDFRHFRHKYYKDLRHLRRLLRNWFAISIPLRDDDYGYAFRFFIDEAKNATYEVPIAKCMIDYLKEENFSGRCEYYSSNQIWAIGDCIVCLGLKFENGKTPKLNFWQKFVGFLDKNVKKYDKGIILRATTCELARVASIRYDNILCGIVDFDKGIPQRIINPDSSYNDSWFIAEISKKLVRDN